MGIDVSMLMVFCAAIAALALGVMLGYMCCKTLFDLLRFYARLSPDGSLLAELGVPVSQPSCPAFGGPDLGELFVTTAWENMTQAQRAAEPLAGHVLHTRVEGVRGQPAGQFGR